MKLIQKTSSKVVLEVNVSEIESQGFDYIWDRVRDIYSNKKFDLIGISEDTKDRKIIFIELKIKPDDD